MIRYAKPRCRTCKSRQAMVLPSDFCIFLYYSQAQCRKESELSRNSLSFVNRLSFYNLPYHGVRKAGAGEQLLPQSLREKIYNGFAPPKFWQNIYEERKMLYILHKFLLNLIKLFYGFKNFLNNFKKFHYF